MPSRPKVFISSTVHDFHDLRSALKFWLEELGYDVLLSEHNDFPAQVDRNSYESCLQAIDDCDYFILLVGSRVGGWYDESARISITQAEYRRAYDGLVLGRVKLLAFVRQDVWDVRQDRRELERYLKDDAFVQAELAESDVQRITNHPSKFVNDAEFTFDFVSEVARLEEMRAAAVGGGPFPPGNWIHQFRDFRDITDALRVEFQFRTSLRRIAFLTNLRAEIESNLRILLKRHQDTAIPRFSFASAARNAVTGGIDGTSSFPGKYLRWLGLFAVGGARIGNHLSTDALSEAITCGEMLDFDRESDAFVVGPMQRLLLSLKHNIERLRRVEESLSLDALITMLRRFKEFKGDEEISVANIELALVLAVHDIQSNVVALSRAAYRAAGGDVIGQDRLPLYGDSPFEPEAAAMERERPTLEQVTQWLAGA